jgi:hypothetical protein
MVHGFNSKVLKWAQVPWLLAAVAFCLCVSCKSPTSLFGPPSPDKIASDYFSALTSDPPRDAFWQYDAQFAEQLGSIEANIPKDMWPQKRDALRQQWQAEMKSRHVAAEQIGSAGPCWQLIQPGASVKVIEIRQDGGSSSSDTAGSWKIFVQVQYPQKKSAPAYSTSSGSHLLKAATIIASEQQKADTNGKQKNVVLDDCSFSPETLVFWPVPPITTDAALTLAKASLPENIEYETITLVTSPAIWANPGPFHFDWKLFTGFTSRLHNFYSAHQFTVNGFTISPGFWYTHADVQPPSSWNQYGVGNGAYRLNDSTNLQIFSVQSNDNHAFAQGQISYSGCTVACSFLEDLHKQDDLGGYIVGNYSHADVPRQAAVTISYQWDPRNDWTVTGFRSSQ